MNALLRHALSVSIIAALISLSQLAFAAPAITTLSPTSAAVGASVTITGTGFGTTQGTSTVKFNGTAATTISSWSATSIVTIVPAGATTGNVVVTVSGSASAGKAFTVVAAPSITSVSPTSAAVGTSITITGTNFGATQGTSTVKFNGTSATPTSWSATSIAVQVPTGATTGNIVVHASGVDSNGKAFTVLPTPTISSLSPTSGAVGASVTITGTNFGATQGTSTVKFNGTAATTITTWSATSIVASVPTGATTGNVVVAVGGVASAGTSFTVVAAPSITTLSPTSGAVGTAVTITGTGFGSTQGTSTVKFNGTTATPTTWSATSISVPVPSGVTTGNVVVHASGVDSNGKAFTVAATPTITGLSPTSGAVGASVTITGTNFGATQGTSTVKFNGTSVTTIGSWSATSITATVPTGATTGSVVVTVGGAASNGSTFTVVAAPTISSVSPTAGAVTASVSISGTNFGATQGSSTVKFNGTVATPTSWGATSIAVPVPTGASTGSIVVHASGVDSNGATFTVAATLAIASLSVTSGAVNTPVTVTGSNFGSTQGTSTVKFNGVIATPSSWSATSIVVSVPSGATTGNVVVHVSGVDTNGINFTVLPTPTISGLSAVSGLIGDSITITGTNFGATQGTSTVTFNGTVATITGWSATSIAATVPTGATSGNVIVTVSGVSSSGILFTVHAPPTPLLKLRINDTPLTVNLSDPMNTDWVIWGADGSTTAATRKVGANLISDFTPLGTGSISEDLFSEIQFSWTDGSPFGSETDATPQILATGASDTGFQITVPADKNVQTLNIITAIHGSAELDASISDGSSTNIVDTSQTSLDEAEKTYSIDFRAATPGQTLTVAFKLTDPNGYVYLRAATLQPHLPEVALTSPTNGQVVASGTNVPVAVSVNQYDHDISSVVINDNGGQIFDMTTPPYSATWTGASAGHHQVQSSATDVNELTSSSRPVQFDVTTTGGSLTESLGQATGTVDLTSEGTVYWRLFSPIAFGGSEDVKASSPVLITDYTFFGNHSPFAFNCLPQTFSFEDGTPDTTETGVNPCAYIDGIGNGLQFSVSADTTLRTLRVYLGSDFGQVKMQAYLSDGSAVPVVDTSLNIPDAATATVYTISFKAASAGQRLFVRFTLISESDWADLNLYAATLAGSAFTTAPNITSLSPTSGAVGATVTIHGTNFGSTEGASTVTLNGSAISVSTWSATQITAVLPNGATTGPVVVTVAGTASKGSNFTVLQTPSITNLSQTLGAAGMPVTITGANFGSSQGSGTVKFNGTTATVNTWKATQIVVTVPTAATTGNVVVHASGVDTNGIGFTVSTVASIGVTPQNLTIPINSVQRFIATATYANGSTQDISAFTTWSSSASAVATIASGGSLTDLTSGSTTVQATFASVSGTSAITFSGNSFVPVGTLNNPRWRHTATLLNNGQVLITGGLNAVESLQSSELYDPVTRTFSFTGGLNSPRHDHVATLLPDGTVLVVGGEHTIGDCCEIGTPGAEIYDPTTGLFTVVNSTIQIGDQITVLSNGKVFLNGDPSQIYDPATKTFTPTIADLNALPTFGIGLASLVDGTALLMGGSNVEGPVATTEIYDPVTGLYTAAGNLPSALGTTSPTLLNDGTVLVIGGNLVPSPTTEIYNPSTKQFTLGPNTAIPEPTVSSNLLSDGSVLAVGQDPSPQNLNVAERYDPILRSFVGAGALVNEREGFTATRLKDGTVLIAGGTFTGLVATAELYGTAPPAPVSLQISPATVTVHLGQNTKFIAIDDQGRQRFEAVWTISDSTIATLSSDSSPTLTPITYGEATVTATIGSVSAQAHVVVAPSSLQVTPATVNMVVGESRQFTVIDSFGNPSGDVSWSVSDSNLATISSDNPPTLTAKNPGVLILTATIEGISGQAQVTISPDGVLLPGDSLWSSPTAPGFAAVQLTQAMPSYTGPALYSIETNGTTQSIVKALNLDGRQRWQKITPILNGNSVPDRNGGLIVTQNNTCFPNQASPMNIVDLDPASGQAVWQVTAAGVSGPNGIVYCYPDTVKNLEPQIALRSDGTAIIAAMTNNGLPALSLANAQVGGLPSQIPIPTSTDTHPDGTTFSEFSPMGPPMVNSDDSTYLEYEVRQITYPPKITSATLHLLKIAPDNSTTTTTLSSTTDDTNLMPGRVIPDGHGGVVATWTVAPSTGQPPLHPYQASHVTSGVPGTAYDLFFSPQTTAAGQYPNLVLGENDTAFATDETNSDPNNQNDGPQVISFNINTGDVNWHYQTSTQNTLSILSATSDGGLEVMNSANGLLRFDSSGNMSQVIASPNGTVQHSWYGDSYLQNSQSIAKLLMAPADLADSSWATPRGNQSGNSAAIEQVLTNQTQGLAKQLPDLSSPFCNPLGPDIPPNPTCGNINAIELITDKTPDFIFQNYLQTYKPGIIDPVSQKPNNNIMIFTAANNAPINVTGPGQQLTITLQGIAKLGQGPFSVLTERVDTTNHIISVVTLQGHPLAGWRYWRVYSIGSNDVVVETGAYDQPGPGLKNYAGYYLGKAAVSSGWENYLEFIQSDLHASQGNNLQGRINGKQIPTFVFDPDSLLEGFWDAFPAGYTNYILNNVCLSSNCN